MNDADYPLTLIFLNFYILHNYMFNNDKMVKVIFNIFKNVKNVQ